MDTNKLKNSGNWYIFPNSFETELSQRITTYNQYEDLLSRKIKVGTEQKAYYNVISMILKDFNFSSKVITTRTHQWLSMLYGIIKMYETEFAKDKSKQNSKAVIKLKSIMNTLTKFLKNKNTEDSAKFPLDKHVLTSMFETESGRKVSLELLIDEANRYLVK